MKKNQCPESIFDKRVSFCNIFCFNCLFYFILCICLLFEYSYTKDMLRVQSQQIHLQSTVPAVRVWDYSCDKIYRNKYGTSARYATVGARARAVRRPCGHNGERATPGAQKTHLRMHNSPQRTMDAGNDLAPITIVEWNGRVQLFILSTHESRSLTSSQQCYLVVKTKKGSNHSNIQCRGHHPRVEHQIGLHHTAFIVMEPPTE